MATNVFQKEQKIKEIWKEFNGKVTCNDGHVYLNYT
jgi:hypothetical protein